VENIWLPLLLVGYLIAGALTIRVTILHWRASPFSDKVYLAPLGFFLLLCASEKLAFGVLGALFLMGSILLLLLPKEKIVYEDEEILG